MPLIKTTKLPLWYIAGILVVILLGIINYLGLMNAIAVSDISMALLFQYMDFLVRGVWFVVNIVMVAYPSSLKAPWHDFVPPFYFICIHAFYVIVILASNMGYRISTDAAIHISMFTSGLEVLIAGFYMSPYLRRLKENKPASNTKHK